jgi:O-antigen/teichoic acid export membrane protein
LISSVVRENAHVPKTLIQSGLIGKVISFLSGPTARSGWSAVVNQGVVSLNNFFTGVIIGRSCSKDEFGLYMLGFSIVLVVIDLQASLVSTPYMVYSPHLKGRRLRLYAGSSLIHEVALSTVVMIALAAWGAALSFGFGPVGLARVIWALVAVISFIMCREFVRRVCFADLRMEIALLFDICVAAVQIAGLVFLYRLGILSADRAYWVIGSACGIAGAGWLLLNRKSFVLGISQAISHFGHNWKFGKWVFASAVLWTVSMNLYPWFLTFFHGTASAGVWAACLGVMALVNVPLLGMQNFLGPKIANIYAEGGANALRRFVFKASLFLLIVMSILCWALFVAADPLLGLFYGAKYTGNGLVVFVLALGLVAASVAFSFSRALFAIERSDTDFKVNFVSLFILFVFGIWLVRSLGPLGAASGLLLANVTAAGVRCASFAILSRSTV